MPLTEAKKRLLDQLKRSGASTPGELAAELGFSEVAARQHLQSLLDEGFVRADRRPPSGRGRPATEWALTPKGHGLFPDRHGELTVALLASAHKAFGAGGVERMLEIRADEQVAGYRAELRPGTDLESRVEGLARLRTAEGYMAESVREGPGSFLLIENHCPICDAAKACAGLCATELDVFRRALGAGVDVQRTHHVLAGDARCVYRIQAADAGDGRSES